MPSDQLQFINTNSGILGATNNALAMPHISGMQAPLQELRALDSYIDVDFAQLFGSSVSISDDKSEIKWPIDKPRSPFGDGHEINSDTFVENEVIIDDEEEIDPLTIIRKPYVLTPESSLSGSSSRSSSTSASTTPSLNMDNAAQTVVISSSGHKKVTSDSTIVPDIDDLQHLRKRDTCNQSDKTTRPSTPLANPIIHIPTTRIELRALYEKFPDICPSIPAPPPAFFNRVFNQKTYLESVRSPPTSPRKYGQPDSHRLAESFASRTPLPIKVNMHPRVIKENLREWYQMEGFMAKCRRDEELNPYPHLNLNSGWNRARVQGEQWHDNFNPWQKPNKKILDVVQLQEQFARFSWSAQVDAIVVDGWVLNGVFGRIFEGVDSERERMEGCGLKRVPGAWWGRKKRIFYDMMGRGFREELFIRNCLIWDRVKVWASEGIGGEYGKLKRKIDVVEEMAIEANDVKETQIQEPRAKKLKKHRRIAQVMSAAWRSRRRDQEKKAGRWTDGTPLQNRMWLEFHWVLDAPDYHDRRFFDTRDWPRVFAERGWSGVTKYRVWTEFYHGWVEDLRGVKFQEG
ncbi:e2e7c6a4-e64b-41db-be76-d47462ca0c11 [Sclerotinia trifoliorum]|uniref:E2e7c6a4-e64b-41db-be76-d47462ca0c11 n=1 Tax=Sclerotinia trifoliorum TaxID=28548 RepID=A0A8H2W1D5_9HELO|nr:e2e7c6a4-e64b-41db-be76-d47462ca0c11 [Sclerotinia trifoliorum]